MRDFLDYLLVKMMVVCSSLISPRGKASLAEEYRIMKMERGL